MPPKRPNKDIFQSTADPTLDSANVVIARSLWLNTATDVLYERNDANTAWEVTGPPFVAPAGRVQEEFTATAGQTTYTTTYTPASLTDVLILINGWPQSNSNLVSLVGKVLTFTAMEVGWKVAIMYTRID